MQLASLPACWLPAMVCQPVMPFVLAPISLHYFVLIEVTQLQAGRVYLDDLFI
jgi:hypothetical protein